MEIPTNWLYPSSMKEAREAQALMAQKIHLVDSFSDLKWMGGMDVSHKLYDPSQVIYASTVLLNFSTLALVEHASGMEKQSFPLAANAYR